jgi:hypothetical protein
VKLSLKNELLVYDFIRVYLWFQLPFLRFSCRGYRFRHVPLAGLVRVREDVNGQMAMYGV